MSKLSRIFNFIKSFLMIAIGAIIILVPNETDYIVVCIIIGTIISLYGIKKLIFFFSSARHMVDGGRVFISGFIYFDLGLLSFLVLLMNQTVAMLYLVGVLILLGAIDILRCIEIKKNESKRWIIKMIKGIVTIAAGIVCVVFANSTAVALLVFAITWIVLGVYGIITCFSKSAVTYIPEI